MADYQHPCRYCHRLVPPDSAVCPLCGKTNPSGPLRCPKCHSPIQSGWIACARCGQSLKTTCPGCFAETFFGDHCDQCGARLVVHCPNPKCRAEQPPLGPNCQKCGKPL